MSITNLLPNRTLFGRRIADIVHVDAGVDESSKGRVYLCNQLDTRARFAHAVKPLALLGA